MKGFFSVLVGWLTLGVLLAARHDFTEPWVRHGLAACAGVVLMVTLRRVRRRRERKTHGPFGAS